MFSHKTLATLLKGKRMKQSHLSRATGIPRNSIARYVSGEVQPRADKVISIARALNVGIETLIEPDVTTPLPVKRNRNREVCYCPFCGGDLKAITDLYKEQ